MEQLNAFILKQYVAATTLLAAEREEGQGMVEYALIIALVAVVLIVALGTLEGGIANVFTVIGTKLNAATAP